MSNRDLYNSLGADTRSQTDSRTGLTSTQGLLRYMTKRV